MAKTTGRPLVGAGQRPDTSLNDEAARFTGVFLRVAPAMFLGSLDQTIVATALPVIAMRFGSFASIAWIVSAYLLAATIAAPIYGRLGDAIGRKVALLGALALFIAGSLACAVAPSFLALVLARAVQGLGGGGLMTISQALIGEAVSPRDRGRFQGWFGALFAAASTLGPVLGGVLSEHVGWRSIFWINVPLGVAAAAVAWHVRAEKGEGKFSPDPLGTFLFVAATLALLVALSIGTGVGWGSAPVLVLLAGAILGFAILLPVERRVATPLLSPSLLAQPMVWRASLCVLLYAAALFASLVQFPLLLELSFGIGPASAGLLLLPLTLAEVGVSTWAGFRISATGLPRTPLLLGLSVATLGFAALTLLLPLGPAAIALSSILFGLGLGTTMPAAQTIAQWAGGKARLGVATSTLSFARSVGGVMGSAGATAILLAAIAHYDPGHAKGISALLDGSGATTVPLLPRDVVDMAFRWVFGAIAVLTLMASLLAWSIPRVDLADPEPSPSGQA